MKFFKTVLFASAMLLAVTTQAREFIIGISPYYGEAQHKAISKTLLTFLAGLEPGDKAVLVDAYSLTTIGKFVIPEEAKYSHAKARISKNAAVVGALLKLPKSVAGHTAPNVVGAVRLPQFLDFIAKSYRTGDKLDVIVIGSPRYASLGDPAFSMADGLIPGDGHLRASSTDSPFGTAGASSHLQRLRVHFGVIKDGSATSHAYSERIERFWYLYITLQGGDLISFTHDLPTVFRLFQHQAAPMSHHYTLEDTTRLEMIRLHEAELKTSIYDRPVSKAPLAAHLLRRASKVELGLTWECKTCDLDLYARPLPSAETLSFRHSQSPEGIYYKDFQSSPQVTNGFETIAFDVPIDLRALQVAINFYSGKSTGGVKGELRLSIDNRTYAMPFHITAKSGNQGQGVIHTLNAGRSDDAHTLLIDPLTLADH